MIEAWSPDRRLREQVERAAVGLTVHRVRSVAASETLPQGTSHVLVDTTAGSVTITLPRADTMMGRVVVVKKLVAANTLTLDGDGSETIDGAATFAWTAQYQSHDLLSDGTQWWVV